MIRAAWRNWVALMDRREPPTVLAIIRIAVALVLLADLAQCAWLGLIDDLFSPPLALDNVVWAYWLFAGSLACVAIGLFTRVACVVAVYASTVLAYALPGGDRAIDQVMRLALCILALSQSHAKWSVDAWLRRLIKRPFAAEVPAWPRYLILLQLIWVYFSGGTSKGPGAWTPDGGCRALALVLTNPHIARFDPSWVTHVVPLTRVATFVTFVWELTAPIYLLLYYYAKTADRPGKLRAFCNRYRLRWGWLAVGLAFSVGILIFLRIGIFQPGLLALWPALL